MAEKVRTQLAERAKVPTVHVLGVLSYYTRSVLGLQYVGLAQGLPYIQEWARKLDKDLGTVTGPRQVSYVGNFRELTSVPEGDNFMDASEFGWNREGVILYGEDIL